MYIVDTTPNIVTYEGTLRRNTEGLIIGVDIPAAQQLPGPTTYDFVLDSEGFVISCTTS